MDSGTLLLWQAALQLIFFGGIREPNISRGDAIRWLGERGQSAGQGSADCVSRSLSTEYASEIDSTL
jgi:hypothetical protein